MKSIVFDLDDTICYPNHSYSDSVTKYAQAKPNLRLIEHIRYLHLAGFYIIINSARRMVTHNGDVSKIIEDIGKLTETWLKNHDVPYDELIFGKPYSSTWYVDDKAMGLDKFYEWANEISSNR
jgi:capsule biosynthesis phosphatase